MIAGSATPTDARMMWNPSVNAIWLRAASSCEAANGKASISVVTTSEWRAALSAAAPVCTRCAADGAAGIIRSG